MHKLTKVYKSIYLRFIVLYMLVATGKFCNAASSTCTLFLVRLRESNTYYNTIRSISMTCYMWVRLYFEHISQHNLRFSPKVWKKISILLCFMTLLRSRHMLEGADAIVGTSRNIEQTSGFKRFCPLATTKCNFTFRNCL